MKVTTVRYSQLFNTGDYENKKFEIEALLDSNDTIENAFDELQNIVLSQKLLSDAKTEYLALKNRVENRLISYPNDALPDWFERDMRLIRQKIENNYPARFDFSFLDNLPIVQQIEAEIEDTI